MTVAKLQNELKMFCAERTSGYKLPVPVQKNDTEVKFSSPNVYKQQTPIIDDAYKYSPFILIQYLGGNNTQKAGLYSKSSARIRIVFCVYNRENASEGSVALINLMDAVKHGLLKQVVIGEQFKLDLDIGVEDTVYIENTSPYYLGEITCTFKLPPIEREVSYG